MRVLLVNYRFPPDTVGGLERYTQSLAGELVQSGHTVTVVARRTEPGKANIRLIRERLKDGSLLYRIVGPDIRFDRFLEHHRHFDRLFTTALLETNPDVVHINHIMGFSPKIVGISQQCGAAVVLSLHDFYFACPRIHLRRTSGKLCAGPDFGRECAATCFPQQTSESGALWGLRTIYFSQTLNAAQAVIAYSDYVASYFRHFGVQNRPIHIIPNSVTPEFAPDNEERPVDTNPTGLTVAYCGTIAAHKGPHVILEALRAARLSRTTVLLIGHAPERDYLNKLREEAARIPGVYLKSYGKYERKELPVLLRGVDCLVMPSLVPEAGPIAPREALACGVPVVAARLGALPELIVEGENGFTFNPNQPDELAALLQRLATEPGLLAHLRRGARNSPVSRLKEHASQVCGVYDRALQDFRTKSMDLNRVAELRVLHESLVRLGCDSTLVHS